MVTTNSWDGLSSRRLPCPKCMPDAKINTHAMPKDLHGVMRLIGQVVSTGKWLYACHTCRYDCEV